MDEPNATERAHDEYNVDELAAAAGTLTSTVRMYQARGLMPRPRRVGRAALYNTAHLQRLHQIAELQRRGHSLAGISELLTEADRGTPLTSLLGTTQWSTPRLVALTVGDFTERFGANAPTPNDVVRAVHLGLIALDGDRIVADERFIEAGAPLAALGVPIERILDEWEALDASMSATANRFVNVFRRHLWPTLAHDAPIDQITELLDQLASAARAVTTLALDRRLNEAAALFANEIVTPPTI